MKRLITAGLLMTGLLLAGCASGTDLSLKEGWELMVAKEYPAARDHYEAMLEEKPGNPYAHLNLGVAYQHLGERELAREHYEAAIATGGSAEISMVAEQGAVNPQPSTVAEVARENLKSIEG